MSEASKPTLTGKLSDLLKGAIAPLVVGGAAIAGNIAKSQSSDTELPAEPRIADTQPAETPAMTLPLIVPGGPTEKVSTFTLGETSREVDLSQTLASVAQVKNPTPEDLLAKYQTAEWHTVHKRLAKTLKEKNYDNALKEIENSAWAKDPKRRYQIEEVKAAIVTAKPQHTKPASAETGTEVYGPLTQQAIATLEGRGFKQKMTPEIKACIQKIAGDNDGLCAYMYLMIAKESGFNPNSCAKTSSAAGLTQFLDSTFIETIRNNKEKLPKQWQHLSTSSSKDILANKKDPLLSVAVGRIYAENNLKQLQRNFPDKDLTSAHLYAAHFLGMGGATKLIRIYDDPKTRNKDASAYFPEAAKSNPGVFKNRTIEQVMRYIEEKIGTTLVCTPYKPMSLYIPEAAPEIGMA